MDCDDDCTIEGLEWEISECDTNGFFFAVFDFESENTSDSFCIVGNGNNYGRYAFGSQPVTIDGLEGDCETEYEFVIFDCENEDCRVVAEIGEVCCDSTECNISELEAESLRCNGDSCFVLWLNFEHQGTSSAFTLSNRDGVLETFEYEDLPVVMPCFPLSGEDFELIRVCDRENPDCCAEIEIEAPDCNDTGVKDLEDLGITAWHSHQVSRLYMNINSTSPVEWRIVDIHSRPVLSGKNQGQVELNTENLKSGAYVLIANLDGQMASMTFIKI